MMRMSKFSCGLALLLLMVAAGFTQAQPGMPRPVKIFYENAGELTDDYRTMFEERLKANLFEHPLLLRPVTTPDQAEVIIWLEPELDAEGVFTGVVSAGFQFPDDFPIKSTLAKVSPLPEALPYQDDGIINLGSDPQTAADIATALYDYGRGDCDLAEIELTENPTNTVLQFFLANCALLDGDYEKAERLFELALADDSDEALINAAINLAWVRLELDEPETAFSLLDTLVDRTISDAACQAYVLAKRAGLHALNFDYDVGLTDINAALELTPDDAMLYVQRGQIYLLLYQWDDVLADYDRALELDPTYADAYFYRGVLYYTVVVDRDKALPDFERYLELAPFGMYAAEAMQYQADIQAQLEALKN